MEKKVEIVSYRMIYLKLKKKAFLSLRNSLHKIDMIGCPNNFLFLSQERRKRSNLARVFLSLILIIITLLSFDPNKIIRILIDSNDNDYRMDYSQISSRTLSLLINFLTYSS